MAEARYRLPRTHPDYGLRCPVCAGPKNVQHALCRACWFASRRDQQYWARRTCACGGPKARSANQCRVCANRALVGAPGTACAQSSAHPWRRIRLGY